MTNSNSSVVYGDPEGIRTPDRSGVVHSDASECDTRAEHQPDSSDQLISGISERTPLLSTLDCPRCGSAPYETYELPCGCVEAFCNACTDAPRYYGYVVTADAREVVL